MMDLMAGRLEAPALPAVMRLPLGVAGVLSLLAFGVLALRYWGTGAPGRVDRWALEAMGGTLFEPSPARSIALIVNACGEPDGALILLGTLLVLCFAVRQSRLAVLAVAGPGVTVLSVWALKPLIGRTVSIGSLAFPSGHTAFLTATALVAGLLVVARLDLRRSVGVLVVGMCVAVAGAAMFWSQTVLFAHYPTDTVGGFLLALVLVPAVAWELDRFADSVTVS